MSIREIIIANYIEGYNMFDIEKMVKDLHETIVFKNISNGEISMSLMGLQSFIEQARISMSYFSTRTQIINSYTHQINETEIEIDYKAILAIDFPNGLKKGDELKLHGKSIFKFSNNKIIEITDIS